MWMDREGTKTPLRSMPTQLVQPSVLAGWHARLAIEINDGKQLAIWVYELGARHAVTQLTLNPARESKPVWTPDGRHIAFWSNARTIRPNLYWQRADGTGDAQRLTTQ